MQLQPVLDHLAPDFNFSVQHMAGPADSSLRPSAWRMWRGRRTWVATHLHAPAQPVRHRGHGGLPIALDLDQSPLSLAS